MANDNSKSGSDSKPFIPKPTGDSGFSTPQNQRPFRWEDIAYPQKQR